MRSLVRVATSSTVNVAARRTIVDNRFCSFAFVKAESWHWRWITRLPYLDLAWPLGGKKYNNRAGRILIRDFRRKHKRLTKAQCEGFFSFFADRVTTLMSPRTAKYVEALVREGDSFDYRKWLKRIREEEAQANQAAATGTSGELAAAEIGKPMAHAA
jgi:hypothetical protein